VLAEIMKTLATN